MTVFEYGEYVSMITSRKKNPIVLTFKISSLNRNFTAKLKSYAEIDLAGPSNPSCLMI